MKYTAVFLLVFLSPLAHGQAIVGFEQAQQQDLERKHALQMQREAEQYALELARIQAQSKAAQPIQAQPLWESGNAFLQHCAASLQKADQPNTQTDSELFEGITCSGFLRGLEEGVSFGVQFAEFPSFPLELIRTESRPPPRPYHSSWAPESHDIRKRVG